MWTNRETADAERIEYTRGGQPAVGYEWGDTRIDSCFSKAGILKEVSFNSPELVVLIDFDRSGKLQSVESYDSEFQLHGYGFYYHKGKLSNFRLYEWGELKEYGSFIDNRLKFHTSYTETGKIYTELFEGGSQRLRYQYSGKKMDGTCLMNFESGKPQAVLEFENGNLLRALTYAPDGSPVSEITEYTAEKNFTYCSEDGSLCCDCAVKKGLVKCRPHRE